MSLPNAVLLFNPHHSAAEPDVFHDASIHHTLDQVPSRLFHLMREGAVTRPQTGVLYTAGGSHDLSDFIAALWNSPEATAVRAVSVNERYQPPHLDTQRAAHRLFKTSWAEHLASIAAATSPTADTGA